jgi:hypothetical protein
MPPTKLLFCGSKLPPAVSSSDLSSRLVAIEAKGHGLSAWTSVGRTLSLDPSNAAVTPGIEFAQKIAYTVAMLEAIHRC